MDIRLLYFEDCPSWKLADERLSVIAAERPDVRVTRHVVDSPEEAERTRFHGSPSIQVDGIDIFAEPGSPVGLSCRRYLTPDGYEGAPTLEQLRAALARRATGSRPSGE
ncbi:MAG: thioredoxin family protein [Nocardioides sp.]